MSKDLKLSVGLAGHSMIDYDKRKIRKVLNEGGAEIRKAARRLVARRGISNPGDFPGRDSGALMRSIKVYKRGTRGGWVKVGPTKTAEMGAFYPAFLFYGSEKRSIAPRANYMTEALDTQRESVRSKIRAALPGALVPR
jgi:hypothetical protein